MLLLFVSVFLHEVAHAVVARSRGHEVTELAVTIWGGHTAYSGTSRRPLDGILISVVGPLTNLLLALVCWVAFQAQPTMTIPALLLYAAAFSNAFVGVFNLLPGLPLDGGQILESVVWAVTGSRTKGTIAAGWVGRVMAVGIVVVAIGWPLADGRQVDLFTVVWAALIGAFLWSGAGAAIRTGHTRQAVAGLTVAALAYPAVSAPVTATVSDVVDSARRAAQVTSCSPGRTGDRSPTRTPLPSLRYPCPGTAHPGRRGRRRAASHGLDRRPPGRPGDARRRVVRDPRRTRAGRPGRGRVVGLLDVTHVVAALKAARGR
ncbi:site-2 protease family protein [Oerskovia sp. M15]